MDTLPSAGVRISVRPGLHPLEVEEVLRLVEVATEADGVAPLSEHVAIHLRHGGDPPALSLVARAPGAAGPLLGYAHLDVTDPVEGASAEFVVHPAARGQGTGRALVAQLLVVSSGRRLRLWAHGGSPAAAALARSMGFEQTRVLWQMRRPLAGDGAAPLPEATLPAGVAVRPFVVGQDEPAWLEVNARAFADHPEQGRWTLRELVLRESEPWFDPAGFFLAVRRTAAPPTSPGAPDQSVTGGRLVGFHWTKVHGSSPAGDGHQHAPIGEVYVVGVDPDEQGTGLGRALTVVGLRSLRDRGLDQAMLYVDEDNTAAIGLYERLGFARYDVDVGFSRDS